MIMIKDEYIVFGSELLSIAEMVVVNNLFQTDELTVAECGAYVEQVNDESSSAKTDKMTYEQCARGLSAAEMLILSGFAEWSNPSCSRVRATESAYDYKGEFEEAYQLWEKSLTDS